MIVAVTGGTGFLGPRVVRQLLLQGHEVRVLTRRPQAVPVGAASIVGDLSDTRSLHSLCAGAERLIHMASVGVQARDRSADAMKAVNVRGTVELVDVAARAGVAATVITGTVLEYRGGETPLGEDAPTNPLDAYGATKSAGGLLARTLADRAGHALIYLRVASMLGTADDEGKLVPQVLRALRSGESVALTSGAQEREWLHVDDGAAAVVASLRLITSTILNIGTGVGLSVRRFLERLAAAAGADLGLLRFGAKPPREGEPSRLVMDVTAARRVLGWQSDRTIDDIVAELAGSVKG